VTPPKKKHVSILRSPASQSSLSVDTTTPPTRPPGRPKELQRKIVDPTNEMNWELYDTPVALHVWVVQGRLKRVKFGSHVKFKIHTTSSLDSLEEIYQLLQDQRDTEDWDITADQEGFKLYSFLWLEWVVVVCCRFVCVFQSELIKYRLTLRDTTSPNYNR
jgi:hypothetical protein